MKMSRYHFYDGEMTQNVIFESISHKIYSLLSILQQNIQPKQSVGVYLIGNTESH